MPVRFTNEYLKSLKLPTGKLKFSATDAEQRGLVFDLTQSGGYFQYRYTINGRQRSISLGRFGPITVKEARTKAAEHERSIALGHDPQEVRRELRETPVYADFLMGQYMPHVRSYKRSHDTDLSVIRNHIVPAMGHLRMSDIKKLDINEFVRKRVEEGLAPGTINRLVVLIRYSFNLAIEWETPGIEANPASGVRPLRENNKIERYLSDEEAMRLKESLTVSINPMLAVIVAMLLVTGARKREVLDARWEDIDVLNAIWRIPTSKSGKARHIPLTDPVRRVLNLAKHRLSEVMGSAKATKCPWIFPNPKTGSPFVSIFYAWDTARIKAGLPEVRIHDLRHTFASTLVNSGVPIYEVQKILGHQHIRTTERYAHLAPERLQVSASVAGNRFAGIWGLGAACATTPLDVMPLVMTSTPTLPLPSLAVLA